MSNSRDASAIQNRRRFLSDAAALAATGAAMFWNTSKARGQGGSEAMRDFLRPYVLTPELLDPFFDPNARVWAKFHPTYGYLLRNAFIKDGVDGSFTLSRYEKTGQRKQVNFPDQPCRINSYGNSFTQGHQVSDGETWQEILAAHFCEPIRNFGIGGFGVYQAYRRLIDTEPTDLGAEYLLFNIFGDDHYRSIYSWRWLSFPPQSAAFKGVMFHANPWVHGRLDHATGELIEGANPCPDETTLRKLCDPEFVFETFGNDEVAHAMLASRSGVVADKDIMDKLAALLKDDRVDWSTPEATKASAGRLLHTYGVRVGMKIMEKTQAFAKANGKKLMVLLSYPMQSVMAACSGTPFVPGPGNTDWHPQEFKDFLTAQNIPWVDSLPVHVAEFQQFKLTPIEYVKRYYIGHYTPRGNSFFAFAVKDAIVNWLDPKPPTYRSDGGPLQIFKKYLPGPAQE